MNFAKKES